MTSGRFHHIDSIMLDPTCGREAPSAQPKSLGAKPGPASDRGPYVEVMVRISGAIRMFAWENLAGLKRLARKLLFLAPTAFRVF